MSQEILADKHIKLCKKFANLANFSTPSKVTTKATVLCKKSSHNPTVNLVSSPMLRQAARIGVRDALGKLSGL